MWWHSLITIGIVRRHRIRTMRSCSWTAWRRWLRRVCLEMTSMSITTIRGHLESPPTSTCLHRCPASAWEASSLRRIRTPPTWRWPVPTEIASVMGRRATWTPNILAPAASREQTQHHHHPRSHRQTPSSDGRTLVTCVTNCRSLVFVCHVQLGYTWT